MEPMNLEARVVAYGLLSRLFISEPNGEAVCAFSDFEWEPLLGIRSFDPHSVDFDTIALENRSEFARMFLGPKKLVAPPYESVYRSGSRQMNGSYTRAVRECYDALGIRRDGTISEPDDFVGFELQFCSYLLTIAQAAKESGDEESFVEADERYENFFYEHIASWIPAFCDDILDAEPLPLMAACALTLKTFVDLEKTRLKSTSL